jgi:hypothetical protein
VTPHTDLLSRIRALFRPGSTGGTDLSDADLALIELAATALDRGGQLRADQVEALGAIAERALRWEGRGGRALRHLCAAMWSQALRLDEDARSHLRCCEDILDGLG